MKYSGLLYIIIFISVISGCREHAAESAPSVIGNGQMPNLTKDSSQNLHIVYGNGDSIFYVSYSDEKKLFSSVKLVGIVPKLAASHSRGPQIAASDNGLSVIAANSMGDIFSFTQETSGNWSAAARVNDQDTTSKEGLMAFAGDGKQLFAVWLDLRDHHNKIFGSGSSDGGKSWSANKLIYASPDTTVCECCKPSVIIKGNLVNVMFRNWLDGNRDLYLMQSNDNGKTFGQAQKIGNGSWKLDGCPMDGGGMTIDNDNIIHTVFRREGKIYSCEAGKPETEIGEGKGCTLTNAGDKQVYAWTEKGVVTCLLPGSVKKILGKGNYPVITAVNKRQVMCLWENEKQIQAAVLDL